MINLANPLFFTEENMWPKKHFSKNLVMSAEDE